MENTKPACGSVELSFVQFNFLQARLIKGEHHRRETAKVLGKKPDHVTCVELVNHWVSGGGRDSFNSRYHRSDAVIEDNRVSA